MGPRSGVDPGPGPGDDPSTSQARARRRLRELAHPRLSRGQLVAATLTLVLGFALVAQVRTTQAGDLEDLGESDLIALLDDVTGRGDKLQEEIAKLEADLRRLEGAQGDVAAAEAAQERLDSYRVLAGTVPVQGPGITVLVSDPGRTMTPIMMVDLIQELRDAGAEAIQIGSVRVVASSWVGTSSDNLLMVDGTTITSPYRAVAIGDARTLAGAMAIPGGFNDSVRRVDGVVDVSEDELLTIDALHEPTEPGYARPVPSEES